MPNTCYQLKTEYEVLKKLNAEFVSSCEKAGDSRILTSQQLQDLQVEKQKLERARDALVEKIGDLGWKNVRGKILNIAVEEYEPFLGRTLSELIASDVFRHRIMDHVSDHVTQPLSTFSEDTGAIINIVTEFQAVLASGYVSDHELTIARRMCVSAERRELLNADFQDGISEKEMYGNRIMYIIKGVYAASELGMLDESVRDQVREWGAQEYIQKLAMQQMIVDANDGRRLMHAEQALKMVANVHAACELGFFKDSEMISIRKLMADKVFRENLVEGIALKVERGIHEGFAALLALQALNAVRAFCIPSQRHLKEVDH